jgi:hypothetical protein
VLKKIWEKSSKNCQDKASLYFKLVQNQINLLFFDLYASIHNILLLKGHLFKTALNINICKKLVRNLHKIYV